MFEWYYVVDRENGKHLTGIIEGECIVNAAVNLCRTVDCYLVEITSLTFKDKE